MIRLRVLFLTAVMPEARALARGFGLRGTVGGTFWTGGELGVAAVGVRATKLEGLGVIQGISDVSVMVSAGLAGALSPALRVGDVVVDARGCGGELPALGRAHLGGICTSDVLVASPARKAELYASTQCAAVDMETGVMAEFAAARGAAFLAIRGISDAAEEAIDPALLTLVDEAGRPRVGRAMGMLLRHPGKLGGMLGLQRATTLAMRNVVETAKVMVASGWPTAAADRRTSG